MQTSLYYTPQANESQSKNNIFLSLSGTQRNPSCEIFWGMQKSYDYFYEQFGIRGYDNNNSRIRSYYHEYSTNTYSERTNINGIDVAEMNFGNTEVPEKEEIVTTTTPLFKPILSQDRNICNVHNKLANGTFSKIGYT